MASSPPFEITLLAGINSDIRCFLSMAGFLPAPDRLPPCLRFFILQIYKLFQYTLNQHLFKLYYTNIVLYYTINFDFGVFNSKDCSMFASLNHSNNLKTTRHMEYTLKFTYSTEMVFDYLQDCWMSYTDCIEKYGERAARHALFNPGRIVKSENFIEKPVIYIDRIIKS